MKLFNPNIARPSLINCRYRGAVSAHDRLFESRCERIVSEVQKFKRREGDRFKHLEEANRAFHAARAMKEGRAVYDYVVKKYPGSSFDTFIMLSEELRQSGRFNKV